VIGLEPSPRLLAMARQVERTGNGSVEFIEGSHGPTEDIGGCFIVKASNDRPLVFIYYGKVSAADLSRGY
jgi:hypothetical protein